MTIPDTVAARFTAAFDKVLANNLADRLTCEETDALAELLTEFGHADVAQAWIAFHADGDGPRDAHHATRSEK